MTEMDVLSWVQLRADSKYAVSLGQQVLITQQPLRCDIHYTYLPDKPGGDRKGWAVPILAV